MEPAIMIVLATFATYRLSTDLAWESGPLGLYATWRGRVMQHYGADDWRSEGVSCPICWSFWVSIPFAVAVAPWDWTWPLWWLGIAGLAAFFARVSAP
jgi:hypothetical protein